MLNKIVKLNSKIQANFGNPCQIASQGMAQEKHEPRVGTFDTLKQLNQLSVRNDQEKKVEQNQQEKELVSQTNKANPIRFGEEAKLKNTEEPRALSPEEITDPNANIMYSFGTLTELDQTDADDNGGKRKPPVKAPIASPEGPNQHVIRLGRPRDKDHNEEDEKEENESIGSTGKISPNHEISKSVDNFNENHELSEFVLTYAQNTQMFDEEGVNSQESQSDSCDAYDAARAAALLANAVIMAFENKDEILNFLQKTRCFLKEQISIFFSNK